VVEELPSPNTGRLNILRHRGRSMPKGKELSHAPLVAPPPTLHCDHCGGELRLRQVEADRHSERQSEVFVCISCGRQRTFTVSLDPYTASAASINTVAQGASAR